MSRTLAAAAGLLIAGATGAFWTLTRRAPEAVVTAQWPHPITSDPERLAFGLDTAPRDLILRSSLGQEVEWSVRTGSRFEITPSQGTIPSFGSTAVRVKPSSSLTVGLNAEHTWFNWRARDGAADRFLVALTAIRAPAIDYDVIEADGELVLKLNGENVASGLRAGENQLDVQGSRFILTLRVGSQEVTLTEGNHSVTITLDRDLGFITLLPRGFTTAPLTSPRP